MVPEKNGELTENDLKTECVKDEVLSEVSGGDGATCLAKPAENVGADGDLLRNEDLLRNGDLLKNQDLLRNEDLLRNGDLLKSGDLLRNGDGSAADLLKEPK